MGASHRSVPCKAVLAARPWYPSHPVPSLAGTRLGTFATFWERGGDAGCQLASQSQDQCGMYTRVS